MTRIEELRAELEREVRAATKPFTDLRAAANALDKLARFVLKMESSRKMGDYVTADSLLSDARDLRALLYFLDAPTLQTWATATRAFLQSALVDSLGPVPIECPRTGAHQRDTDCEICGARLVMPTEPTS